MKKLTIIFALAAILLCFSISTFAQGALKPANVISATDVQFPAGSVATGIVVIDVSLDAKGTVTGTYAPRAIASLTATATSSVLAWKYQPASLDSTAVPSIVRVAFAFRPHAIMAPSPQFQLLLSPEDQTVEAKAGYIPPGILAAAYPAYPINAANVGAVVIQLRVNADGKVEAVKVVRPYNPFTKFAIEAARKWQFRAATLQGEPVASNVVLAFVFSSPILNY
jgi:TonB family protein